MHIEVEEVRKIRRASACIRTAGVIAVKVPRHWPRTLKHEVIEELADRLRRKDTSEKALLRRAATQPRLTLNTQPELEAYVRRLNAETFNAPLGKVRLGNSQHSHLAQVNLRTRTLTVSKYCLQDVPAEGLRYLVLHELAHYFEAGHNARFWGLVAQHVPDYKRQSKIMKAFHHQTVIHGGVSPFAFLDSTPEALPQTRYITRPASPKPASPPKPKQSSPQKEAEPFGLGFFKQLLLWGNSQA